MKKTAAVRSLLYAGDLIAVDLGTFAVKILHLKAKVSSLAVLGSASREVWGPLAGAKSEEDKNEIYARTLRELLAAHGFKTRNASISLAGSAVVLRFVSLPAGFTLDPDAGIPAEARAAVPFEEPDAVVSTLLLDGSKADKKQRPEMMLAAARRQTVQDAMSAARKAGLRPAVLINDVLALANAHEFFRSRKADETIVLINAGATSTSVTVVENGVPKAARILNIAGNTFTRAVKREFDIGFEEAEKLKIAHGLSEGGAPDAARVARALKPAIKDLSSEIRRTIDVFLERRSGNYPGIRRIALAGGSAELKGLPECLASDTGMSVELFCPMVNVTGKGGVLGIAPLPPAMAVSCGLALSNTLLRRSTHSRVNLVSRRARRAAILQDISPGFWRLIAGPAFVVMALCVYGVWAVRMSHKEIAAEQRLEAATKAEQKLRRKFAKKKTEVVVKRAPEPFAYLGRLLVSGVFGEKGSFSVMLNGDGKVYSARGGKLFDGNEEEVRGVACEIRDNSLALTAGGRRYSIELPK